MELRFKKTKVMEKYQGFHGKDRIEFSDGEIKDVPDEKAEQLLEDYPEFFTKAGEPDKREEPETPAVNRAIRSSRSKGKSLKKK